jgi:hypothetical protein
VAGIYIESGRFLGIVVKKEFESIHLNLDCNNVTCAASKHLHLNEDISTNADWNLLSSPLSVVNESIISSIATYLSKEEPSSAIFVLNYSYDNIGQLEIAPLVEEMGWSDPKYVSGPVVMVHREFLKNFKLPIYVSDESLFWYPVVKSVFSNKARVLPFPTHLGFSKLDYAKVLSDFDYHDLHRQILIEFELGNSNPWHYQELIMALKSANNLDTTKSHVMNKIERISTRILFPAGTIRRKIALRLLKIFNFIG